MSKQKDIELGFYETLGSLQDILDKILVVGGWCPFLYTKYYWKVGHQDIPNTTDIDFGVWETGSLRYDPTVYDRLLKAGYETEPYSSTDTNQVEFLCNAKDDKLKIEFITSFYVSDDTLSRFLGDRMACHRIEAFEILLQSKPLILDVPFSGKILKVRCLQPSTYLYHKGITFIARSGKDKRDKDMLYIHYILRYCPALNELLDEVMAYQSAEEFDLFKENILKYFGRENAPGYRALNPLLSPWMPAAQIKTSITSSFAPLLARLRNIK